MTLKNKKDGEIRRDTERYGERRGEVMKLKIIKLYSTLQRRENCLEQP